MDQAVAARKDVHERPERGDVHHLAVVDLPHIGGGRIEDQADLALGLVHVVAVGGRDGDDARVLVVVHVDIGPGLGLDRVDHLALGPDDLADLVQRDLELDDLGGGGPNVVPRGVDGPGHHLQDLEPGVAGLVQRVGQHIGGEPIDLGVKLERGHEVGGARHLEVHVTKRILGTQDVGEGGVLALVEHQAHGDARHRRLDGHARVHERQRGRAHRAHRGGAVGGEHLRHQPQRVGELVHAGDHRNEGLLGQRPVADLPALGTPHEAGLAGGIGREVVVVDVPLLVDGVDPVDHLVHPGRAQGGDVEHLGLAPLEQPGPVGGVHHPHIGGQRADVGRPPAVDAHAVAHDPGADNALGERAHRSRDLLVGSLDLGEPVGQGGGDLLFGLGLGLLALCFVGNGHGRGQLVGPRLGHRGLHLGGIVHLELVFHGGLHPGGGDQPALESHRLFDPLLGLLQPLGQGSLVHLGRAVGVMLPAGLGAVGLHHHDGHVAVVEDPSGHHHLEGGVGTLGIGGMGNPLAVGGVGHPHRPDGASERDARNAQRGRGPVDGDHVVGMLLIGAQNGAHDVDLVAETVGERRPQGSVDQPTGQDGRLRGPAFPAEERAGNLARGVHPLFDVDGQGEEVGALAYPAGRGGGYQNGGVAHADDHGAVGLPGQTTCLKGQGFAFRAAHGG